MELYIFTPNVAWHHQACCHVTASCGRQAATWKKSLLLQGQDNLEHGYNRAQHRARLTSCSAHVPILAGRQADAWCLLRGLDSRPLRCLQFVLNTDETVNDMREHLAYIYSAIYGDFVAKNPVYVPGQPFRCATVIVSGGLLKSLHLMACC